MEDRLSNSNEPIHRVKCVVDSCHFWASGNHCTAQKIEIEPSGAIDTEMTDCATFLPEEDMH